MSTPIATPASRGIAVASLGQARKHKRRFDAVITVEDPACRPTAQLRFFTQPRPAHLVLQFEDVDDDSLGIRVATLDQVAEAIAFAEAWETGSLLVHCFHGVGRSAGIALAILASRYGAGQEGQALDDLLKIRPEATPNLVVVKLADQVLDRHGALQAVVAQWEARTPHVQMARQVRRDFVRRYPQLYAHVSDGTPGA